MKHAQSCGVRELPIPLEHLPADAEEDEIDQSVADILKVKYHTTCHCQRMSIRIRVSLIA